jgi:hypothetical protein
VATPTATLGVRLAPLALPRRPLLTPATHHPARPPPQVTAVMQAAEAALQANPYYSRDEARSLSLGQQLQYAKSLLLQRACDAKLRLLALPRLGGARLRVVRAGQQGQQQQGQQWQQQGQGQQEAEADDLYPYEHIYFDFLKKVGRGRLETCGSGLETCAPARWLGGLWRWSQSVDQGGEVAMGAGLQSGSWRLELSTAGGPCNGGGASQPPPALPPPSCPPDPPARPLPPAPTRAARPRARRPQRRSGLQRRRRLDRRAPGRGGGSRSQQQHQQHQQQNHQQRRRRPAWRRRVRGCRGGGTGGAAAVVPPLQRPVQDGPGSPGEWLVMALVVVLVWCGGGGAAAEAAEAEAALARPGCQRAQRAAAQHSQAHLPA